MTPEEFEQAVLADEITDFESYLQEPNNIKEKLRNEPYRLVLLKHGIEIERILELDPTLAISVCIQEGLLPERYDEWKAMNQEWIMETFAENGYYLDELIMSEYDDVRKAVIENNPEFCIERLNQGKIYQAESQNGIIGNGDQLPWHIASELKHFKRLTTGHSVVMGYRTADGLKNKTFANRNMILYHDQTAEPSDFKNFTVMNFGDILNLAKTEDVFVAGGAATYKDFLPFVDAVIRTIIAQDYEGNVPAPEFEITDEMTVERIPVQNEGEPAYIVEYITLKESN